MILFAHGARDPEWADPFRALQGKVSARRPDLAVALAFLEVMTPSLAECVSRLAADGHRRITIAPLFLAQGGHLKKDLPRLLKEIERKYPDTELTVLPPIGEVTELLETIAGWLVESTPR